MISKIVLTNLQRHSKLVISLDKGLNVVRGTNNRGKSTIVRSIYWTFYNRPLGDWMLKLGSKLPTTCKICIDDDIVKRIKGCGKNEYVINDETYSDVATKIPVELKKYAFKELVLNKTSLFPNIAFSSNKELPFATSFTDTLKYAMLSYLTGCDKVERVQTQYLKEVRECNADIRYCTDRIEELNTELLKYEHFQNIEDEVYCLTVDIEELKKEEQKYEALLKYRIEFVQVRKEVIRLDKYIQCFSELDDLDLEIEELFEVENQLKDITTLQVQYAVCIKNISKYGTIVDLNVDEIENMVEEYEKLQDVQKCFMNFCDVCATIDANSAIIDKCDKELKKFKYCPHCNSEL